MVMQDVGYKLVCEPGKDEADPLDYLSRHPLPEIGDDSNEKIIRYTVKREHAVVFTRQNRLHTYLYTCLSHDVYH